MTAPVNPTPLSVDYTSRDYYSVRNDLITRIQDRLKDDKGNPIWTGNDPADFGVALVEAFAYMADTVNYYIDRMANESFIGTATQRQSVLNIAQTYGYYPTGYRAASTSILVKNSSASQITVPAGTQFAADVVVNDAVQQVLFTSQSPLTLNASETAAVTCLNYEDVSERIENVHSDKNGEILGSSSGQPSQQFTLDENQVIDGSVQIWVKNGSSYVQWTSVTHLTDYGPTDQVFSVTTDANNFICVTFGDGISGYIPPQGSTILTVYYVGGGILGNVSYNTPFYIYHYPRATASGTVTTLNNAIDSTSLRNSTAAIGGSDPESTDAIRQNAPKLLTTYNRAVSLADYANLSLAVTSVGKANAQSDIWTSVNVYAAPQASTDPYPGYSTTDLTAVPLSDSVLTNDWLNLKSQIVSFLSDKTQIGVTVSVLPPVYIRAALSLVFTAVPGYSTTKVIANIKSRLFSQYSYANMPFASVITPEELEANLRFVEGVLSIRVTSLTRLGGTAGRNTLIGAANELFTFEEANTSITGLSSNAALSGITSSGLTLVPTFVSSFYNYNFTTTTSTTTVTFTSADGGTITANGVAVTSGVGTSIATPTGTTVVPVIVTAADGIARKTYTVTFTH